MGLSFEGFLMDILNLEKTIKLLAERNQIYKSKKYFDEEIFKTALVKSFELCYECLKKSLDITL